MLAIFTDEKSASDFSNKIHEYLKANRPGYNAERWSYLNKSDKEDKWFVKVPYDYQKFPVKLDIKEVTELVPIVDAKIYLRDWYPEEIIEPIIEKVIIKR